MTRIRMREKIRTKEIQEGNKLSKTRSAGVFNLTPLSCFL